jgi:HK97 family phage prohead protease
MPYEVIDNADNCAGFAVVKVGETEPIEGGCHHTKEHADDHASALNIATEDEERAIDLSAPAFMRSAAKRGLELYAEGHGGDGLVQATIASARKMANGDVSIEKWRKIGPWIARHLVDLDAPKNNNPSDPDYPGAGLVAHLLWGSGPSKEKAQRAMNYANRLVDRYEAEERASDPSTPAPKKDQVFGSDTNKPGSAKGPAGSSTITLNDAVEKSLQNKTSDHNERMSELDKPAWTKVTVGALRSVYRRGAGAFSTSHRPGMTRGQWAMGRVNAFLYLAEKGKPENPKYVSDNDLLNKEHPKYSKSDRALESPYQGEHSMDEELYEEKEDEMPMEPEEKSTDLEVEVEICVTVPVEWVSRSIDDKRSVAYSNLEARAMGEGNTLIGYAALWDTPSLDMGFTEYVTRGAFTKTLKDGADVRLLFDHEGAPLARTKSGTLRLSEDERGLKVEADLDPANPMAQSIMSALRRGDLNQMSFAFRTIKDSWNNDRSVRELREVQLFDVSVVTYPAYEETVAELRAMQYNHPVMPTRLRRQQIALVRTK